MEAGARLRQLRGSRTIKEVAGAVGISESALQMYETGKRRPRDDVKQRLAEYYRKSVAFIFFPTKTTN